MLSKKEVYIKEWLSFAKEDLDTANALLSNEYFYNRSICYHCQQAAEKDLKAYIIYLDLPLNKTHNLSKLLDQIKDLDVGILKLQSDVDSLSDYIVTARYPDDSDPITDDEAKLAFEVCKKVNIYIKSKIVLEK
jgi:HEPN domain-containing protein